MEAVYTNKEKRIAAGIGDLVMAPGTIRGIVIAVNDSFVTILGIATSKETGDTFVLTPRFIHDFPAGQCLYMEKQTLNFF